MIPSRCQEWGCDLTPTRWVEFEYVDNLCRLSLWADGYFCTLHPVAASSGLVSVPDDIVRIVAEIPV